MYDVKKYLWLLQSEITFEWKPWSEVMSVPEQTMIFGNFFTESQSQYSLLNFHRFPPCLSFPPRQSNFCSCTQRRSEKPYFLPMCYFVSLLLLLRYPAWPAAILPTSQTRRGVSPSLSPPSKCMEIRKLWAGKENERFCFFPALVFFSSDPASWREQVSEKNSPATTSSRLWQRDKPKDKL